jgi:hypothetical protein
MFGRILALLCAFVAVASSPAAAAKKNLPTLEFTANLLLHYKDPASAADYDDKSCRSGGCEQAVHNILQPWQEWAMEEMGHRSQDYTCDRFDDYTDCPYYPAFQGDKILRYCSRCRFTNDKYDGITDVGALVNTTILKWTQTHTIDSARRVLNPVDEKLQGCPCLGLKYKYMVDYYVSEVSERRRLEES